jgi:hypothetical protein
MKSSQIEFIIVLLIAGYNLVTLPFNSFIIILVVAVMSFMLTKSLVFTGSIFVVPQLILLMNTLLLNKNESFVPKNAEEVINNVKQFRQDKPSEGFNNPNEIIDRVKSLQNKPKEENNHDDDQEELEGTIDSLKFLEQFDNLTEVNENQRIHTVNENMIPAMPTIMNKNRPTAAVEAFDNTSLNTALIKSSNTNIPISSNMKSVEIN